MKIRFSITLGFFIALLSCLLFIGCGSKLKNYPSLVNQGIIPLSPSNSYLGSNLFLGEEAAKSRILYQFLKGRGAPGAIEITEKDYKPASMRLFYPRHAQVYLAELSTSNKSYEWIVRGPYSIERTDFRKLIGVEKTNYEAAPIIVFDKVERFVPATPTPAPTIVIIKKATPTPLPKKKVKPKVITVSPTKVTEIKIDTPKFEAPTAKPLAGIPSGPGLNSDQQAIRIAKGLTALSPEGDLVHKVESKTESLESIAEWYTGDSAKAKAIAEFNSLPAGSALPKGAKIKIPKAFVKTEKAMEKQTPKENSASPQPSAVPAITIGPASTTEHGSTESKPDSHSETQALSHSELATDIKTETEPEAKAVEKTEQQAHESKVPEAQSPAKNDSHEHKSSDEHAPSH